MRMHEQAGPPPALKTYAPLMEDVNAPYAARMAAAAKGGSAASKAAEEAAAREEVRKLQRALQREKRGAARELRRDREFIVRAEDQKRAVRDGERSAKLKELMTELQQQQATFNQQVRGGGGIGKKADIVTPGMLHSGKKKFDRRARKMGGGGGGRGGGGSGGGGGGYGE
jgi:nucleolar protein 14